MCCRRFHLAALGLGLAGSLLPGSAPAEPARFQRALAEPARFQGWTPLSDYVSAGLAEGGTFRLTVPTRAGEVELELRPVEVHAAAYRAEDLRGGGGERRGRRRAGVRTFASAVTRAGGSAAARAGPGGDFARLALEPSGRVSGLLRVDGVLYDLAADTAAGDLVLQVGETDLAAVGEVMAACGAAVDEGLTGLAPDTEPEAALAAAGGAASLREVELGTEADALFVAQIGGVEAANARIASMVNAINGIYEYDLGLTNRIVFQRAWDGDDPYTSASSDLLLSQFGSDFAANVAADTDVAVLFSGRDFENNVVGRAWLRAACSDLRFGVNQYYQQNDALTRLIVAHEMGHNLGSNHTAEGLMAPTISQNVTWFSPSSREQIDDYVARLSCLGEVDTGGPPLIEPIGPQAVVEGETLELELEASDPDGDSVRWAALPLPVGASLGSGGSFRWRPAKATVGCGGFEERPVTFYARDPDGNTATETVLISVVDAPSGAAPELGHPAERRVPAGRALEIPLAASDPDGDSIAFSAAKLPSGAALSAEGVLTWTPSEAQRGLHEIAYVVTDCTGAAASGALALEVVSGLPQLTGASAASGVKGDELVVTGRNLLGRKVHVWFGARKTRAFGVTDTSLAVRVPKAKRGQAPVTSLRVVRDGLASENALPFTYVAPPPGP